jgi:GDPmannose 4,6-dehydratase
LEKNYEVYGVVRRSSSFNTGRLDHLRKFPYEDGELLLKLNYGNLMDASAISNILYDITPDEVYNLRAQSHVRVSFDEPIYTADLNSLGCLRVLEAIRMLKKHVKFYQASSSEMYGKVVEKPQAEKTPFNPQNIYACAKVFSYWQTKHYREAYKMFACNGILFNHEWPRRGETFVTRKITRSATRIKMSLQDKLYLGNLDAKRDWGFAGDYVSAMWLVVQQENPDDFVVARGETRSVREFLDEVFSYLDLDWEKHVEISPRLFRPTEVDLLQGDSSKARQILGWEPKVTFKNLARMMTDADMRLAKNEALIKDDE